MADPSSETKDVQWVKEEPQELRVFFFIGSRAVPAPISNNPEDMVQRFFAPTKVERIVVWAFGFQLEEAAILAKEKAPGYELNFTGQKPTLREFLVEGSIDDYKQFAREGEVEKKPELTPRQLSFEQFRAGILFFINESAIAFKIPEDKETLKRIIGEVVYKV